MKIAGSAASMFIAFYLFHPKPLDCFGVLMKLVLLIAFGAVLVILKVIDSKEMAEVKSIFRRLFARSSGAKSTEELL
jgi:hypothetical protein